MTNSELNQQFTAELDVFVQRIWKEVFASITSKKVIGIQIIADTDEAFLKKYGLNEDIKFVINASPEGSKMDYYYKGGLMKPDNYWLRPDNYHEVTTLQMLQECIKQDKHTPDIKSLEDGLNEETENK